MRAAFFAAPDPWISVAANRDRKISRKLLMTILILLTGVATLAPAQFGTVQVLWYFVVLVWPVLYVRVYL